MNTRHLCLTLAILGLFTKLVLAQDNPITKLKNWKFHEDGINARLSSIEEYSYSSNGSLERNFITSYNQEGEPTSFSELLFTYFANGCTNQIKFETGDELTVKYYNEIDCRIDSVITSNKNIAGTWRFFNKNEYLYEPLQITIRHFWFNNSEWHYGGNAILEENDHGQVVRFWTPFSDFVAEEERIYTYDNNNNVTTQEYYLKHHSQDSLVLVERINYLNTYNSINQLSLIEIESVFYDRFGEVDFTFNKEKQYSYYCDNLLKEERVILDNEEVSEFKRYYYKFGTDCEEEESYKLYISPNPVANKLTIQSQALYNKECSIRIIDSKGSIVQHVNFSGRIRSVTISMSTLSPGLYHVIVDWPTGRLSKKVVKM